MRGRLGALALVAAGVLAGTMLLTPVGAHINNNASHVGKHTWKAFIKDAAKKQGNQLFQRKCQDGAVLGFATVAATATFSSSFTSDGVVGYSCASNQPVEARRELISGNPRYEMDFPGLAFDSTLSSNVQITTVGGSGAVVGLYGAGGTFDRLNVTTYQVGVGPIDKAFSVTIFRAE